MLNADTKEFEFLSGFDELNISAVSASPSGSINGVVQLIHGMNEHKELYYPFMDYLASEGFITVISDNRGHGKSICAPDDLGYMFRDGSSALVSDIAQLNRFIREAWHDLPVFIFAHGMGSVAARCFMADHSCDINGIIISGCPCYSGFSSIVRSIESASAKKPGSRFRSDKIYNVIESCYGAVFDEDAPNSWRCSDPEVVGRFNADPLCSFKPTLNCYEEMLVLTRSAYSKAECKAADPSLPIRFLSGKDDPCMLSEKKFFKNIRQLEKGGYESISHRLFDGMRHDIIFEKNSSVVWKDVAKTLFSWVDRYNDAQAETEEALAEAAL